MYLAAVEGEVVVRLFAAHWLQLAQKGKDNMTILKVQSAKIITRTNNNLYGPVTRHRDKMSLRASSGWLRYNF